jgi:ABC-2 type transport system ATP-binding protein
MQNMETEIKIENLRKIYSSKVEALRGVDLEIKRGKFFALLGPNGAGKSTLVKIITTLEKYDSGNFSINGFTSSGNVNAIRKHIGVALQEDELDPMETPERLLVFQGRLFGLSRQEAKEKAGMLIDQFKLNTERSKKVDTLSGGNKRRLHCALALVHNPRVLFLDEPTNGMDPLARATFWNVIETLNERDGVTVFLTTQYLEEADRYAAELALLIDGRIHFVGTTTQFKAQVNPGEDTTLEESYIKYVESLKF